MMPGGLGATGFHSPTIEDLFPPIFLFDGTPFAMNRIMLVRLILLSVFLLFAVLYVTRAKVVPGRAQGAFEFILNFCRVNIAEEIMGKTIGRKYAPLITTIFFTVLFMNIGGIIPGLNMAGTASPGLPLVLAVLAWVAFIYAGLKEQGAGAFLKSQLFPPGVPWPLYLLLTPIEAISTFVIRPFTLFVRLLANMISGHFMLALTLSATNYFVFYAVASLKPMAVLTLFAALAFTLFEILVACLQAYIFAILTSVYINLSVHAH
ncbi:MAG: F0F1 ATP synthase subunit A [Actinomycetaceae bacterium]|nr:F0F1 ATP synthase subunit A [Actinomycetaceae bacterium]